MIINFGSINIDHVYRVSQLPAAGETCISKSYAKFLGGKGVNQSIAISKAQGDIKHIGAVGADGQWALDQIKEFGVGVDDVARLDQPTGHAIICVDDDSENHIVIESGANQHLTKAQVDQAMAAANVSADWTLLQNETNLAEYIVDSSRQHGLKIVYSAAPFVAEVTLGLVDKIDLLAVNEVEAVALCEALGTEISKLPVESLLVTKGASGSEFWSAGQCVTQQAFAVDAVDSTGAGDTFLGSFLALFCGGSPVEEALEYAAAASAIQVTREGAAASIPDRPEVETFLKHKKAS